jgi:hypothetical protein
LETHLPVDHILQNNFQQCGPAHLQGNLDMQVWVGTYPSTSGYPFGATRSQSHPLKQDNLRAHHTMS